MNRKKKWRETCRKSKIWNYLISKNCTCL